MDHVGDIIQSNNGRTRLTQKTNNFILKGYHKFVPRIQPRCWVLQIANLENDHKISCVFL